MTDIMIIIHLRFSSTGMGLGIIMLQMDLNHAKPLLDNFSFLSPDKNYLIIYILLYKAYSSYETLSKSSEICSSCFFFMYSPKVDCPSLKALNNIYHA